MTLLRVEDATAASVASRVGYASEAAFSTAFARHVGLPPGTYRRRARAQVTPAVTGGADAARW